MISVRLLGHIKTSVGRGEVELGEDFIDAAELVDRMRAMAESGGGDPGFSRFNTLVLVEEGEAFMAASQARLVRSGDRVVLIPFSHGG